MRALRLLPAAIALSGCMAYSVQPLHDKDTRVQNDNLPGIWDIQEPDDEPIALRFEPNRRSGNYRMTVAEEDGHTGLFDAHLVALAGRLFLDIQPATLSPPRTTVESDVYWELLLRYHVILEIELQPSLLTIRLINFYEPLSDGRLEVPHLKIRSDYLINVPTDQLQQLVVDYLDDPDVRENEVAVFRKRRGGFW